MCSCAVAQYERKKCRALNFHVGNERFLFLKKIEEGGPSLDGLVELGWIPFLATSVGVSRKAVAACRVRLTCFAVVGRKKARGMGIFRGDIIVITQLW